MGRLQLTIAFASRDRVSEPVPAKETSDGASTEAALKTDRLHQAVEADRRRWVTTRMLGD